MRTAGCLHCRLWVPTLPLKNTRLVWTLPNQHINHGAGSTCHKWAWAWVGPGTGLYQAHTTVHHNLDPASPAYMVQRQLVTWPHAQARQKQCLGWAKRSTMGNTIQCKHPSLMHLDNPHTTDSIAGPTKKGPYPTTPPAHTLHTHKYLLLGGRRRCT